MADVDLSQIQASASTKLVGSSTDGTEQTPVQSSSDGKLHTVDVASGGGLDSTLTIAAGVTVELKVGVGVLTNRKYVQIQAKDNGIKWGFSSGTQNFDAFKAQFFILPFGPGTSVFLKNTGTVNAQVAIAEVA
jgi:hypothetical protein